MTLSRKSLPTSILEESNYFTHFFIPSHYQEIFILQEFDICLINSIKLINVVLKLLDLSINYSVQSLSHDRLFATPSTAACQAFLSITTSQSLLKLMSIASVMPSNHLILSSPSPPAFNLSEHQGLFQGVSSSHQVAKVLELQLQHQSFQ